MVLYNPEFAGTLPLLVGLLEKYGYSVSSRDVSGAGRIDVGYVEYYTSSDAPEADKLRQIVQRLLDERKCALQSALPARLSKPSSAGERFVVWVDKSC